MSGHKWKASQRRRFAATWRMKHRLERSPRPSVTTETLYRFVAGKLEPVCIRITLEKVK